MPVSLTGLMLSADRSAQNVFPCLNRFKKGAISTEGLPLARWHVLLKCRC